MSGSATQFESFFADLVLTTQRQIYHSITYMPSTIGFVPSLGSTYI